MQGVFKRPAEQRCKNAERALRQIDDAGDAKHQRKADRDQSVGRPDDEAAEKNLQKFRHGCGARPAIPVGITG